MRVFIPKKMPEPAARDEYDKALTHWIRHFVSQTHGKAFVLFTSYQTMQKPGRLARRVFPQRTDHLPRAGRRAAPPSHAAKIQGRPRLRALRHRFLLAGRRRARRGAQQRHPHPPALRRAGSSPHPGQVRAHHRRGRRRLPPIFAARGHPEIRQGVGRLIRTQSDKGIIVILDNRVLTKAYGKAFLAVLPKCPVEVVE